MMKLPEVKKNLADFEKASAISDDVLVRVEGFTTLTIGRYSHYLEEWQVNGRSGWPVVAEWWPLPEKGTGEQVK